MEDENFYKKLGFKCGLEIHQQLDTHKLFCSCPSLVNDKNKPDIIVKRKLRAVAGELGKIDEAAKFEMEKDKTFIYEACSSSSCLVELDEEPPHEVNKEALRIALQIAKMLNAKIVDEIHFMRKTVIDGSNTTGFQRTALIAYNGFIETSKGRVKIETICLEEEAAKKIKQTDKETYYRLDRLGVPLVEIATSSNIKDPEHCKEVAEKIGLVLRSTKVKRGIGTIRQDVNISIKNGARIEIKGFQDLKSIPKIIENEVKRQLKLIKQGKKLKPEVRKAEKDLSTSFLRPMPSAARLYPETDVMPIITKDIKLEKIIPLEEKIKNYKKLGLNENLAKFIAKNKAELFEQLLKFKNLNPSFIASTITSIKSIGKKHNIKDIETKINNKALIELFSYVDKGKLPKNALEDAIVSYALGKFNLKNYEKISKEKLKEEIKKIIEKNKNLTIGAYMGIIMKKYKGKVEGKEVMEILKKCLSN